ncbi:MAG: hypothetical protein ACU837_02620 [Gammaproteobacteria bacterium]
MMDREKPVQYSLFDGLELDTSSEKPLPELLQDQREAYEYLCKKGIDWAGKPVGSRDEANIRR